MLLFDIEQTGHYRVASLKLSRPSGMTMPLLPIPMLDCGDVTPYETAHLRPQVPWLSVESSAQHILQSLGDALLAVDTAGNITCLNAMAERLTGWSAPDALGRNVATVMRLVDAALRDPVPNPLLAALADHQPTALQLQCLLIRRDGSDIAVEDSVALIHDLDGHISGAVMVFRDVSIARAESQRLALLAWHDELTGLPNRNLLQDRLTQAMAMAQRHGHQLAVIFMDLDHFKRVNDQWGHFHGDQLLQSVALRLQACVRNTDAVCRWGGDEFVILLSEVTQHTDACLCAEKILAALQLPHLLGREHIVTTVSMGIAVYPADGDTPVILLKNADHAMYRAKAGGRSGYRCCTDATHIGETSKQAMISPDANRDAADVQPRNHFWWQRALR